MKSAAHKVREDRPELSPSRATTSATEVEPHKFGEGKSGAQYTRLQLPTAVEVTPGKGRPYGRGFRAHVPETRGASWIRRHLRCFSRWPEVRGLKSEKGSLHAPRLHSRCSAIGPMPLDEVLRSIGGKKGSAYCESMKALVASVLSPPQKTMKGGRPIPPVCSLCRVRQNELSSVCTIRKRPSIPPDLLR